MWKSSIGYYFFLELAILIALFLYTDEYNFPWSRNFIVGFFMSTSVYGNRWWLIRRKEIIYRYIIISRGIYSFNHFINLRIIH
jgi:hypothetical protein